ncbi:MAG: hypothetical protein HY720_28250 [Planctomycetes bacterium]|nr:hypothetical protein [Planctomycetota bacterium]
MKRVSRKPEESPTRNGGRLEAAVAILIETQARFVSDMDEIRRDFAAVMKVLAEHSRILGEHSRILAEHSRILEALPDVIREKIGFAPGEVPHKRGR